MSDLSQSPATGDPPVWFSAADFIDLPMLVERLRQARDDEQDNDSVSQFIVNKVLSPEIREMLGRSPNSQNELSRLRELLVQDFNRILRGESLYGTNEKAGEERFEGIPLRAETRQLLGASPSPLNRRGRMRQARLNRLLLEDAYPEELHRLPDVVHCVPDLYKQIREEIHYEHSQINARMLWYTTAQTFLIWGMGYMLAGRAELFRPVAMAIAVVGMVLSTTIWFSLHAAASKIQWLRAMREGPFKDQPYYMGSAFAPDRATLGIRLVRWIRRDSVDGCGLWFPKTAPCVFFFFWLFALSRLL